MNGIIPHFIVHYSRGEPFKTLTGAPKDQWQSIIKNLRSTHAWGLSRFSDPNYLEQRVQAENRLRSAFIAKGGKPQLHQPIYFFLGRNSHFEEHNLNRAFKINLERILSEHVSFTYGDSMLALVEKNRKRSGLPYENPLCNNVYRLEELRDVVSSPHFPVQAPLAIEAQLWITPSHELLTDDFSGHGLPNSFGLRSWETCVY